MNDDVIHHQARTRSPRRFFMMVLGLVLALAAADLIRRTVLAYRGEPTRGACWIWRDSELLANAPTAFYAVRDFELAERPTAAWLDIAADEGYVAYLNGRRIGAGTYAAGEPIDRYLVSEALVLGSNRLTVELRSLRGAGGLLASLRADEHDRVLLVSDESWRIFERFEPALWTTEPLGGGQAVRNWGLAPTGRWRLAAADQERPISRAPLPALLMRHPNPKARWIDLERPRKVFPKLGLMQIFDWGRQVSGYLALDLVEDEHQMLLIFSADLPRPQDPPDELIVPLRGRPTWEDTRVRTFRYCLLVGGQARSRPRVLLAEAEAEPSYERQGVFGLEPPAAPPLPGKQEVWDRLRAHAAALRP